MEAELETEYSDDGKLFSASKTNGEFIIRFDKIFEKPELALYNTFRVGIKRNFTNEITRVLETYGVLLLDDNGELTDHGAYFLLHLLDAKIELMQGNTMNFDKLFYYIDKMIDQKKVLTQEAYEALDDKDKSKYAEFSDYYKLKKYNANNTKSPIIQQLENYIDSTYVNMDDSDTEKYKKNKDYVQLAISNDQAKAICAVSYMHRLIIPLIAEYLWLMKTSDVEEDEEDLCNEDVCNMIFDHIIECTSTEPKRIRNKLYKLVESRVHKMCFSASSFWEKASDYAVNPSTFIDFIYKKVINSALHKMDMLEEGFNIVSYLQSIINNQIAFKLGMKFNETYSYYNPANGKSTYYHKDDNKDLTLDKVEAQLAQLDEGLLIIEQDNKDIINDLPKIFDVSAEEIEIQKAMQFVKINPIQEQLVSLLTYKYFNSINTIKTCSRYEYAKILLCCSKYLAKNNFVILSKILISNCYNVVEKITISGNKIKAKIEQTKTYRSLIENKYASYRGEIERPLQSLIATIRSSNFVDDDGRDIFDSGITIDDVANEICELVYLF